MIRSFMLRLSFINRPVRKRGQVSEIDIIAAQGLKTDPKTSPETGARA
jgi:hypothetical protein